MQLGELLTKLLQIQHDESERLIQEVDILDEEGSTSYAVLRVTADEGMIHLEMS